MKKKYGLDTEEATFEEIVHEPKYELWLQYTEWPDGICVDIDEKSGKRSLFVRDDGEEISGPDLDDDVADMLVRILHKIEVQLGKKK